MRRIEIDTSALQTSINGLENIIRDIKSEINAAYEGINHLDSMWDGEANAAFNRQFALDYNRLMEICGVLETYNGRLAQVKRQYDTGESNVADIVNAIRF